MLFFSYGKSLKYIDKFQNTGQCRIKYLQVRPHFGLWFDPRLTASDPTTTSAGVFYSIAFKPIKAWFPAYPDCRSLHLTSATPRRKDSAMTDTKTEPHLFDPEKYRTHLAPLGLSREQEDALMHELWTITETLVDQSLLSPTYPYQFAIAAGAFHAVEEAITLKSQKTHKQKEEK